MAPASSLVLLFSLLSYCNGAYDYFFVGDLAQYTTNKVCPLAADPGLKQGRCPKRFRSQILLSQEM